MAKKRLQVGDYCKHGHLLTKATLYTHPDGRTHCTTCANEHKCKRRNNRRKPKLQSNERPTYSQNYQRENRAAISLVRNGIAANITAARDLLFAEYFT